MDNTPLLELRALNKCYDNGFRAICNISFRIGSGMLVGLIGPNGCGKSTMMRCINRMHSPSSGDILIDGESILSKSFMDVARIISNVPAEIKNGFGLTVYETVMLGRYPFMENIWWETNNDEKVVTDALEKFGIYNL